ncbi:MAG: chemotaxis protein CheW [Pseudomonadota bacterium]
MTTTPDQAMPIPTDHQLPANAGFMALTFELHDEVFAIEIAHVHEVIDPLPVTLVPNADPFAPGLINARGAIVPVLDLQYRLGMTPKPESQETRFVVLETVISEDRTKFAMVADRVHEVVEFDEAAIQPAPELGMQWPNEFIRGIVQRNGTLVILLNTDTAFRPDLAA